MQRYLLNISYLGHCFRGAQRQINRSISDPDDPSTIQGSIEIALKTLHPKDYPNVVLSSRTDTGVHAFHSTCHVDLENKYGKIIEPQEITLLTNKYFNKMHLPLRVISTFGVDDMFHCRHRAISRTYLYKIVLIQTDQHALINFNPIELFQKCCFVSSNSFDIDVFRKASCMFEGLHDFRTFMGKGSKDPDKDTRRSIEFIKVKEVPSPTFNSFSWPHCMMNNISDFKSIDIYIKAQGFLYNQVNIVKL